MTELSRFLKDVDKTVKMMAENKVEAVAHERKMIVFLLRRLADRPLLYNQDLNHVADLIEAGEHYAR